MNINFIRVCLFGVKTWWIENRVEKMSNKCVWLKGKRWEKISRALKKQHGEGSGGPWRTIGFYGHPNTSKRLSSWQLMEALNDQCKMPWLVCGDFNEIIHPDEKSGGKERDAGQMREFREVLSRCGLSDLGFVGPRFTWCNGRFGDQRTLLRLDRMVANDEWIKFFPEAKVHHISMSASDHCLLSLHLKKK